MCKATVPQEYAVLCVTQLCESTQKKFRKQGRYVFYKRRWRVCARSPSQRGENFSPLDGRATGVECAIVWPQCAIGGAVFSDRGNSVGKTITSPGIHFDS